MARWRFDRSFTSPLASTPRFSMSSCCPENALAIFACIVRFRSSRMSSCSSSSLPAASSICCSSSLASSTALTKVRATSFTNDTDSSGTSLSCAIASNLVSSLPISSATSALKSFSMAPSFFFSNSRPASNIH